MAEPSWWAEARRLYTLSDKSFNPRPRDTSVRGIAKALGKSASAVGYVLYPKCRESKASYQKEYKARRKRYLELEEPYIERWEDRKSRRK